MEEFAANVSEDAAKETGQPKKLEIPYTYATREEGRKKLSKENFKRLEPVLDETNQQLDNNWTIFKSEKQPGVSFSLTRLTLNKDVYLKMYPQNAEWASSQPHPATTERQTKRDIEFYFVAYGLPPAGDPFSNSEAGVDRFVRMLPQVARPLRDGEPFEQKDIYIIGMPTGLGGTVSKEYIEAIDQKGLQANGELYTEFVSHILESDDPDARANIKLLGASIGSAHADQIFRQLDPQIRERTQVLLHNPAGNHKDNILKGIQVAVGLGAEAAVRTITRDPMSKDLAKAGKGFYEQLAEEKGIAEDKAQTELKKRAAQKIGLQLIKGTPLDTENNHYFIRKGIYDPLSFGKREIQLLLRDMPKPLKNILGKDNLPILSKEELPIPVKARGKSLEYPFRHAHFYLNENWNTYGKVFNYLDRLSNPLVTEQAQPEHEIKDEQSMETVREELRKVSPSNSN